MDGWGHISFPRGDPGSIPGQSTWDLWWAKLRYDRFFSSTSVSPFQCHSTNGRFSSWTTCWSHWKGQTGKAWGTFQKAKLIGKFGQFGSKFLSVILYKVECDMSVAEFIVAWHRIRTTVHTRGCNKLMVAVFCVCHKLYTVHLGWLYWPSGKEIQGGLSVCLSVQCVGRDWDFTHPWPWHWVELSRWSALQSGHLTSWGNPACVWDSVGAMSCWAVSSHPSEPANSEETLLSSSARQVNHRRDLTISRTRNRNDNVFTR